MLFNIIFRIKFSISSDVFASLLNNSGAPRSEHFANGAKTNDVQLIGALL